MRFNQCIFRIPIVAICFFTILLMGRPIASAALPTTIEVTKDIVYKKINGQSLALDFYKKKGQLYSNAPLVIFIHGGGYVGGTKDNAVAQSPNVLQPLILKNGYQVASVEYRFCSLLGPKIIDCATDVKDAVRFLVKNKLVYGIDPNRIAVYGQSAGGHLGQLLAFTKDDDLIGDTKLKSYSSTVKCAVSWYGLTDFSQPDAIDLFRGSEMLFFTPGPVGGVDKRDVISPVWYMKKNGFKPNLFLAQGDSDTVVPPSQAVWMDSQARLLNVPEQLLMVKNAEHMFKSANGQPIVPSKDVINQMTLDFILVNNQVQYLFSMK